MISVIFGAGLESIAKSINLTIDEMINKLKFIGWFISELQLEIMPKILALP